MIMNDILTTMLENDEMWFDLGYGNALPIYDCSLMDC